MCFILHTDATSLTTTSKFRVCHPSSVEIVWNSWQRSKPRTIAWLTFPSTKRPPTQAAISISLSCCFCWLLASANDFPGRNSKTIQKPKEYQELNVLRAPLCADGLAGVEDSLEIALCVCVYIYIYCCLFPNISSNSKQQWPEYANADKPGFRTSRRWRKCSMRWWRKRRTTTWQRMLTHGCFRK